MCTANHCVCVCTAAAMPFHPCGSRMLAEGCLWRSLDDPSGHGSCLASHIRKKGGQRGGEVSPPGAIEGLAGSPHVRLTGPTEPWPRKKTYARTLADPTLDQVLPAVPRPSVERDPGSRAQLEPPVLLPGACGHACVEFGHGPPRLPTPACRLPSRQHPNNSEDGVCFGARHFYGSRYPGAVSSSGAIPRRRSPTLVTKSDTDGEV